MRFQPGCLPLSFLLLPLWLQPLSLLSKPTPVSVSEALQRWKGICNAPPLTELCSVIKGKFTGLVCILNTLSTPVQPAVKGTETLVVSVRCLVKSENINALIRLVSFTWHSKQELSLGHTWVTPKIGQQRAVKTGKIALLHCLHIWVMWERYSGAIQGQTRLLQCTKITQARREQMREIWSELLKYSDRYHQDFNLHSAQPILQNVHVLTKCATIKLILLSFLKQSEDVSQLTFCMWVK